MNNKEIYKKTLTFSIRRLLWGILSFIIIAVASAAGFFFAEQAINEGLIGLAVGLVLGIIIVAIISHFISYIFKAGQIAMMTEAIVEGKLPDDVYSAGKKAVKDRFLTVAAYYAATNAIKAIFQELGRVITSVGEKVGGNTGGAVGGTISSAIQTVVGYLCDCCLGWVFYRKDEKAAKATLEGAVLFFKHGKTLARNLGRIFGMGLVPLIVVGGSFFGLAYLIGGAFPEFFSSLADRIATNSAENPNNVTDFLSVANNVRVVFSAFAGLVIWDIVHTAFVRPFILVGVLRNYIESGKDEKISSADFSALDSKSKKFAELHAKVS